MFARISLAAVAVLVLAWTGVLLRDLHVGQPAADRLFYNKDLPPADFERNMKRLEDAELLNPDPKWEQARVSYFLLHDHPRQAARAAEALLRREPANIGAWWVLSAVTRKFDLRRSAQAAAAIERLDPLWGAARR